MSVSNSELFESLCSLAKEAGRAILEEKAQTSTVRFKEDKSPVTSADLASHRTIALGLAAVETSRPILSEESALVPFSERKSWSSYFLVDPLDGTKAFVQGRSEYTVNIALIEDGLPTVGVVYQPEGDLLFAGSQETGAFVQKGVGNRERIRVRSRSFAAPRVVASSSHRSPQMDGFLSGLGEHELIRFGSSLKMCRIAEGSADIYPRFGPTSEWDTAAGHAVVRYAGGSVLKLSGSPLEYNQKNSILNPEFLVIGPQDRDWLNLARNAMSS